MRLTSLMGFLADDLAVDLGTANTLVYVRGQGIVLNEPSIVAMKDGAVLAAGHEAKAMLGPRARARISVVRPLRHGVIADFDSTEKMLHYFIRKTRQRRSIVAPARGGHGALRHHPGREARGASVGAAGGRPRGVSSSRSPSRRPSAPGCRWPSRART